MNLTSFLTTQGQALSAKLLSGSALTITRVMTGTGQISNSAAAAQLVPKQALSLLPTRREGNTVTLPATLIAAEAADSYSLTALGVYAQDPDCGEILYKIHMLDAPISIVPSSPLVLRFYLRETVQGGQAVTAPFSPAGLVTETDFAPVRDRVLSRNSSIKEYVMDASQAQAFLDALPRMMSDVIVLKLTGTLKTRLLLSGFYGAGRIILSAASGSFTLEQGAVLADISLTVGFINAVFPPSAAVDGIALACHCSKYVFLDKCHFAGNGHNAALYATNATSLHATDCTISGYKTAALAITDSIITVVGTNAADFHGNTTGAYVYRGGIILLSGAVPDLLGGVSNSKDGGIIVNAAGAVI